MEFPSAHRYGIAENASRPLAFALKDSWRIRYHSTHLSYLLKAIQLDKQVGKLNFHIQILHKSKLKRERDEQYIEGLADVVQQYCELVVSDFRTIKTGLKPGKNGNALLNFTCE
ncbi:hypothetical protein NC652_002411 [Populus alba x Populus x berolinensis]|nr:hypothetical protein NC652_002411 [Populus alba x Populus x berolinensis]